VSPGELRFWLRCIDKLGFAFRGDESLLDVGCGDGGVARLLSERVGHVVAVDVVESPEWRDAPGIRFQVPDAEHLPFDDGAFDLVHSKDALHHMTDPARALAEYNRVLQPHGTALVVEANRHNPSLFLQMTLIRRHDHFTDERFRELVTAAFPRAAFGAFEAHYVPGATRVLRLQNAVEDALEKIPSLRSVLAYNFAVAGGQTG
jgi:ubiquinone/menaquinone biosynthesis C-methylase UbiE